MDTVCSESFVQPGPMRILCGMPPPSDARRAFRRDAGPEVGALHLDAALEGGI